MSELFVWKDKFSRGLRDKQHPWTPIFDILENKTGVDRVYLCIGIMGFFLLYMLFGYAAQLMCNIFGFVYPAYASIKALETLKKEDDTKWLTYWVVFAFFSIIEFFSGFILHWFPFYWLLKSMFHLWCFVPIENNGSQIIYQRIIRPWFLGQLDRTVTEFKDAAAKAAADAAAAAMTSALLSDRKQE